MFGRGIQSLKSITCEPLLSSPVYNLGTGSKVFKSCDGLLFEEGNETG